MALPHPPRRALAVSERSCCTRGCIAGIPAWQRSAARQTPDHGACHGRLQNGRAYSTQRRRRSCTCPGCIPQTPPPFPSVSWGPSNPSSCCILLCPLGRTALHLPEQPTALGHSAPIKENANQQLAARGLVLIYGSAPCVGSSYLGQKGVLQPNNSSRCSPCFWGEQIDRGRAGLAVLSRPGTDARLLFGPSLPISSAGMKLPNISPPALTKALAASLILPNRCAYSQQHQAA